MKGFEAIFFLSATVTSAIAGLCFAAWVIRKFYHIKRISGAIAFCVGAAFAGFTGYAIFQFTESIILSCIAGFFGLIAGTSVRIWWITSRKEPAKFPRLFGAVSLSIGAFVFASLVSTTLVYAILANILITKLVEPPQINYAKACATCLEHLSLAQKNYKNVKGKYGALSELDKNWFFKTEKFETAKKAYEIKLEAPKPDEWVCIAIPKEGAKYPALWINQTGIVHVSKNTEKPEPDDPVYRSLQE